VKDIVGCLLSVYCTASTVQCSVWHSLVHCQFQWVLQPSVMQMSFRIQYVEALDRADYPASYQNIFIQDMSNIRCGYQLILISLNCRNCYKLLLRGTWNFNNLEYYLLTYLLIYLFIYLFIYSMVQDIILKADCHSACQKISCFLMDPKGSLLCSHKPATGPYPEQRISPSLRHYETFHNNNKFLW
jgi:hypothetical protein